MMNNIASIKKLIKIICISFVLLTCMQLFNSVAYAEMYKFEFTLSENLTSNDQKYVILADVTGDSIEIKKKFSNISYHHNSEQVSESSFYNVIRERYEEQIRHYMNTEEFVSDQYAARNSKYILWLLETFVENTKNLEEGNGSCKITYTIKSAANNSIISANEKGHVYNGEYKEIIEKALEEDTLEDSFDEDSDERRENPYFREVYMKYSDFIHYNNKKLDEIYTDEKLISMIMDLKNEEKTDKYSNYVSVSTAQGEIIKIDNIYAELVENGTGNELSVKLQVKESNGNILATFKIVENGTETCYTNTTKGTEAIITYDGGNLKLEEKPANWDYTRKDTYLMYYDSSGNTISMSTEYVALKNIKGNCIDVYEVNNKILKKVASVESKFESGQISVHITKSNSNPYIRLIYNGTYLTLRYGNGDNNDEEINIGIESMKPMFNDWFSHFDINFPIYKKENGQFTVKGIEFVKDDKMVFLTTNAKIDKKYEIGDEDYIATSAFLNVLDDPTSNIYLEIRLFDGEARSFGNSSTEQIDMDKTYLEMFTIGDTKIKVPVKPLLLLNEFILESINDNNDLQSVLIYGEYNNSLNLDTKTAYINMSNKILYIINRVKPIFMLIILIFLIFTGVTGIVESKSPEARAQMMEKYKNIFFGVIFFACAAILVTLITKYVKESFQTYSMPDTVKALMVQVDELATFEDSNIFLALIDLCLDISTAILDIVNNLSARTLSQTGESIDIVELLYNVYDGNGNLNGDIPFDSNGVEWTRYMSGYKALLGVGLMIMLIAIMKMAIEYIVFAGDEKKVEEIKKAFGRIVIASMIMVLTPFAVKLLIYLFNFLTSLLPVKYGSRDFKLTFSYTGITRTLLNFLYVSMKSKIFYVFLVRKVMIAILLIVTPIIAAAWAVSDKFKSVSIWIGEMITNIALQFAYACGFMLLMIMSYDGQSNEVGLILMMVSLQLSKFIKDSMQGFFSEWGGINEEDMADGVVNTVTQVKDKIKSGISRTGGALAKSSQTFDKDQTTKSSRIVSNIGNVMQGNFGALQSSSDTIQNLYNDRDGKLQSIRRKRDDAKEIYEADKESVTGQEAERLAVYEKNWNNLDDSKKQECKEQGGAFASLYNYKDEENVYKKKLHERAALYAKLQKKKGSGPLNKLRSIGERESDAELDAEVAASRTFTPGNINNIKSAGEARAHLARYGGDDNGNGGIIQNMQEGNICEKDEKGDFIMENGAPKVSRLDEKLGDIDRSSELSSQAKTLMKQKLVEDFLKEEYEYIHGYIQDSKTLFGKGAEKEKIEGLIRNYEAQKKSYEHVLGPSTTKVTEEEVKRLKRAAKTGNEKGMFDINSK